MSPLLEYSAHISRVKLKRYSTSRTYFLLDANNSKVRRDLLDFDLFIINFSVTCIVQYTCSRNCRELVNNQKLYSTEYFQLSIISTRDHLKFHFLPYRDLFSIRFQKLQARNTKWWNWKNNWTIDWRRSKLTLLAHVLSEKCSTINASVITYKNAASVVSSLSNHERIDGTFTIFSLLPRWIDTSRNDKLCRTWFALQEGQRWNCLDYKAL